MSDLKFCTEMIPRRGILLRIAMEEKHLWVPGQSISIGFIGGTDRQRLAVIDVMSEWLEYADLRFDFRTTDDASDEMVRISFSEGKGSWSYIGRQCLYVHRREPTMNFGWLNAESDEQEWRRTILHEAGHMLGAIHEHQSPAGGIKWDLDKLYNYYFDVHGWTRQMVTTNVVSRVRVGMTNSKYDPDSIMHYPIPAELTLDGFSVGWNTDLSETDKSFIREVYR